MEISLVEFQRPLHRYALSLILKALVHKDNKMQASIIIFRAIALMGEVELLK